MLIVTHSTVQTAQTDPNAPPSRQAWNDGHKISGFPGDATKYLDGTGNFTTPAGGGGGGSPGGSNGQIQYNSSGAFGGLANGQIPATQINDNAAIGNVGEYISNSTNMVPGTATISIASPAVITWSGHPFVVDAAHNTTLPIVFSTTGALPTGISAGTVYWVIGSSVTATTFQIATSIANAIAGTAINTTGTQSGTHTITPSAPLTSNTASTLGALLLTAGDWNVKGYVLYSPAPTTTASYFIAALNTSAALPSNPRGGYIVYPIAMGAGSLGPAFPAGSERITVAASSTQIVYLEAQVGFSISSMLAGGALIAERRR